MEIELHQSGMIELKKSLKAGDMKMDRIKIDWEQTKKNLRKSTKQFSEADIMEIYSCLKILD